MSHRTLLVCLAAFQASGAMIRGTAGSEVDSQPRIAGVLEHYEASLRAMQHARFRLHANKFFIGGSFTEDTKILDVETSCVRDGERWKIDERQWSLGRIKGKLQEVRMRHEDVGTRHGEVEVWHHPPSGKRPEKFSVSARLEGEAPPAKSEEEVLAHRGDSGRFAEIPWPTDLGYGGFIFGYLYLDGTSRLSEVLAHSKGRVVDANAKDAAGRRAVLVESHGKFGRHRVWFDPDAGYLPRRVEVEKTGADVFGTKTVADLGPHGFPDSFWPDLPVERVLIAITDVNIRQIATAFTTVGFTYTLTRP